MVRHYTSLLLVRATLAAVLLLAAPRACNARLVEYDWTVGRAEAAYNGVMSSVFTINGKPGSDALIEATLGDDIQVRVTNGIPDMTTSLHWHGFRQFGTQEMDGTAGVTQCHIEPGVTAEYRFTPDKAGTFWWHSHDMGQYAFGLRGPIVIHPPRPESGKKPRKLQCHTLERDDVDVEYTLQLTDWYHGMPAPGPPIWDSVLINSRGRYDCSIAEAKNMTCSKDQPLTTIKFECGKAYLLRLINVGALAAIDFSIDGHEFTVIAVDSDNVVESKPINSLFINIGQRYDVLVCAKSAASSSFWIRATARNGVPWTGWPVGLPTPAGFNPNGLAILSYSDSNTNPSEPTSSQCGDVKTIDEFVFEPTDEAVLPAGPDTRIVAEFGLDFSKGPPLGVFSINGGEFSSSVPPADPPLFSIASGLTTSQLPVTANAISIPLGKHIEVVLVNPMTDQHPFHMHAHSPWIAATGQASREEIAAGTNSTLDKLANPIKRNTYTVPPCTVDAVTGACTDVGFIVLRVDTDNPGAWFMHCHVEWHMDIGVNMLFIEGETDLQARGVQSLSSSMRNTCGSKYAI